MTLDNWGDTQLLYFKWAIRSEIGRRGTVKPHHPTLFQVGPQRTDSATYFLRRTFRTHNFRSVIQNSFNSKYTLALLIIDSP